MEQKEYRLAAIMYTDIAGFSRMMEENESGTLETLRRHNRLINDSVTKHGGRVIKSAGDVFLSEFPNTVEAVRSAVEIQNAIAQHNTADPVMPIYLRVGIHLGDIYFFENDALGEGVRIANRLQNLAGPGRICISKDVFNLVSTKLDLNVRSLGPSKLKNITREIETYEITVNDGAEEPGAAADDAPPGPTAESPARSSSGLSGTLKENLRSPEYADFNELKALVLEEIKRAGRRLSIDDVRDRLAGRSGNVDAALETLADKGFLTRGSTGVVGRGTNRDWGQWGGSPGESREEASEEEEARIQSRWGRALDEAPDEAGSYDGAYDNLVEDYKDHVAAAAEREKAGFRGHLISYAAVNAGLFALWSTVMFGGFPWFLIVALGWGIGLAGHFAGVKEKARESRELDQWPGLTREQLRIYRKLAKARRNWSRHLVSNVATAAFLLFLNLLVSPGFMWAVFPIGFMAIGIFSHLRAYKGKERRLLKRLRDAGASIAHLLTGKQAGSEPERRVAAGDRNTAAYQAEQVRRRIAGKMAAMPHGSPVGEGFLPVLDNYVEQIKLLDKKNRELDQIMHGIPVAELQRDLATLKKQRAEAESEKILAEYDQSILQIERQQTSFSELKNEREILRLRLSSGMSQLKQMEIDLARMASLSSDEEVASVSMLKEKADELSQYLDDLREGYRELE